MKFAVETWAPEYGIAADDAQMDDSSDGVAVDIEVAGDKWSPIDPAPAGLPSTIMFVDGVRRIDARVWITDGDIVCPGVCATVAAGSVVCTETSARVVDAHVERGLFTGPTDAAADIETRNGIYRYFACAGDSPEDLYLGIHNEMTRIETELGASPDCELAIFDGPLRGRTDPNGVGYVKTQHVQYLPEELQPVLAGLDDGQRTPLFHLGGRGGNRYSWYLRLPIERTQPWAGIIRCEVPAAGSVADAVERANQVTALLPRYASEPHKDGRAPQNLYPIAGLENELRRRLGDQLLMERALRLAAK
jgi:hypothetical protein